MSRMVNVVIVGGGFCGAVTAVNLVRLTDAPLAVTVVNTGHPLCRGVAYGTRRPEHLLNVVARNMSALADQRDHFVEWLGTRSDFQEIPVTELREQFVPRRIYGDYLQALFLWYSHAFADGKNARIDCREPKALDIVPDAEQVMVRLSEGRELKADKVVLATGNPPPADLPGFAIDHPRYFRNPWSGWEALLRDPGEEVALLGTGLTMVDAFLTLTALGWRGKIYALSRNGLLPQCHFKGQDYPAFPESDPSNLSLDEIEGTLRAHCGRLRREGLNPAILVDKLRPYTQRLWQHFSVAEKQRFLKEFRTRWNVTRHRVAEAIHRELMAAQAAGRLEILKGELTGLAPCGDGLRLETRGAGGTRELVVGAAINCTGPAEGFASAPLLYRNLLARGLVSSDEVGLGIRATADFAVLDREGRRSKWLMALGPPLKGTLWETTAVPELRAQAFRVAEVIVADLHARRAAIQRVEETYADVLEYSI
jgi:uncharacterized NAD(P)/FAD-binding protein YdhS